MHNLTAGLGLQAETQSARADLVVKEELKRKIGITKIRKIFINGFMVLKVESFFAVVKDPEIPRAR